MSSTSNPRLRTLAEPVPETPLHAGGIRQGSTGMRAARNVVPEVLRSPGGRLDGATRREMESRFNYDFSAVRLHTDARAAESADLLDARAYTVGNDVVFGARELAPGTPAGKRLLSHELVHVMQGRPASGESLLRVGPVDSSAEREATALSDLAWAGGARIAHSVQSGLVQRTMKGAILGGVLGAAGGATLGALAGGGIGALIGGAVGLVGGALIGEDISTKRRKLSAEEIKDAKEIFQDSIDYSKIEITRDSAYSVGAPRTIGNTIHLKSDWGDFVKDTLDLTETGKETLIHEMTHVWQYQNGGLAYIPLSLIAQIKAAVGKGSRNAAYDWRGAIKAGLKWEDWNPEQQAELVEDYNKALKKIHAKQGTGADYQTVSMALPYVKKVQHRQGAPSFGVGAPSGDFMTGSSSPAAP